jgi:thiopurine S-methyltransferase
VESVSGFEKWKGESISLLTGDFFNVDVETAGGVVDAVWDRGSLVAIQPTLREQYVEKLGELLCKPNGRILLSTYVRPNGDIKTGPPFSIDEAEVRRLFEGKPWVESVEFLDSHSAASLEPWYKAIALYFRLGNMQEHIYLIKTK